MPRNYVVRSDPDDLDFFHRFDAALAEVRERTGVRFGDSHVQELDDDLTKYVNMDTRKRGAVNMVDDGEIMTRFVEIEGESEAFEARIAEALVPLLDIVPPEELRREARKHGDERHLKRMALGAGERADDATVSIVADALRSGDEARVAAGAEAAVILQWPELLPALRDAAAGKHRAPTRRLLETAAEACGGEPA